MGLGTFFDELENAGEDVIRIDQREDKDAHNIVQLLEDEAEEFDMDVQLETLDVGDYVYKDIGIERKEKDYLQVPDVLAKAEELKKNFNSAFVFISDDLLSLQEHNDQSPGSGTSEQSITGLTASLIARGVQPIFCSDRYTMIRVMLKTFSKLTDDKDREIVQPIRPKARTEDWKEYIVLSLPHVGEAKSEKLMQQFGSVQDIVNASKQELTQVDGIGNKIASDILEVVTE